MKNKLIALLLIWIFFLSSCSAVNSDVYSDIESEELNAPSTKGYEAFFRYSSSIGTFIEISSGSYYSDGEYIYYTDNDNVQYVKLCGKPDCSHNDLGCNAYIDTFVIGCYEDHIYWVTNFNDGRLGYGLYRMNLDGTDHEIVYALTYEGSSGCSYLIHNGYLFYRLRIRSTDSTIVSDKLYKRALEANSTPEEICDLDGAGIPVIYIPVGDNLFILLYENDQIQYYKYNIESEEINLLIDNYSYKNFMRFGYNNAYIYVSNEGLYEFSYEDCSISLACELDIPGNYAPYFYGDYIFFIQVLDTEKSDDNLLMYVFTDDYEQLAEVELDFPITDKTLTPLYAICKDKILFSDLSVYDRPTYYAYIEDIINGEAEFYKID